MSKHLDPIYRLAIVEAHKWVCVICRKPITEEFDIDHMVPKELAEETRKAELNALCARLNRPDFDVWGLHNLGPAHRGCNNEKGVAVYPDTVLHNKLTFIDGRVEDVKRRIANSGKARKFEKAMLVIMAAISTGKTSEAAVNARLVAAAHSVLPPTPRYAVAWTPACLDLLRGQGVPMEKIESAIASAVQRGEMKLLYNPALPRSWVLRFSLGRDPWRAYATLDDGLLLVTKVLPKRQAN
jgi:hypothetical protein